MAGNIAACVPGTSPRAGTGHLVRAQTDALAEIAARCREAGGGGKEFPCQRAGICHLSLSSIHVIFFYVL